MNSIDKSTFLVYNEKKDTERVVMSEKNTIDTIYEILENEILFLEILPGEPLSENTLCSRFDVSRTPARSVLQRLHTNGLVHIESRKNTTVSYLNFDEISQMIYQRIAVESMVLRDFILSANAYQIEQVKYLLESSRNIHAEFAEHPSNELILRFYKRDLETHKFWFVAQGKEFLWNNICYSNSSYNRFKVMDMKHQNNFEAVLEEHTNIVDAIVSRNIQPLEEIVARHLNGGVERMGNRIFTDYKDYFKIG